MLIRSQDKKRIANFSNVDSICIINNFNGEEIDNEICSFNGVNDSKTNLGKYSTEEKAIKALDMIENAYCKMKQNECTLSVSFETLAVQNSEIFEAFLKECRKVFIYQMPQDEEV